MRLLEITTRERVRAANPNYADASFDAPITDLIKAVSKHAADRMGRHLKAVDRVTEIYEMKAGRRTLTLYGMPIESVSYVKVAPSRVLLSTAEALTSEQYAVINAQGQIEFQGRFSYAPVYVEVSYIGGMANDTADFMEKYAAIAASATHEVVNRLNRAKNPEGNLAVPFGTSIAYSKQLQTLEDFNAALDEHPRVTF